MNQFTPHAQKVLELAQQESARFNHGYVGTEHLLLGIAALGEGLGAEALSAAGVDLDTLRIEVEKAAGAGMGSMKTIGQVPYTPRAKKVLAMAGTEVRALGGRFVGTEHILLGLLREGEGVAARVLANLSVSASQVRSFVMKKLDPERAEREAERADGDEDGDEAGNAGPGASGGGRGQKQQPKTPALSAFGRDLTALAQKGELDPVVGRADEIERVTRILCRRTKNNPVLLGEAGVGKTAIVEGLAQLIAGGEVPDLLRGKRVVSLDLALMVAGTKYRGQFEERIKAVMDEIRRVKNVILFVDELHSLVGAGSAEGAMDAANILKPALSRGEIQLVGATTLNEYRKFIEKDSALERRFQTVMVREPSQEEAVEILRGLRERYEKHHHTRYSDEALRAAVSLSARYLQDRFLPDKAIDVLDEAGARARIASMTRPPDLKAKEQAIAALQTAKEAAIREQQYEEAARLRDEERAAREALEKEMADWQREQEANVSSVSEDDVRTIVSKWTGVPLAKMEQKETAKLLEMEAELGRTVIGQADAIGAISRALRRSRADLKDPRRPIGSFIFMGPTGVGKTLLAKSLAEFMFNSPDALIQLDMSEYMEKFNVSRLVGSPPGYVGYEEGGQLTERVRRRPYSVVLFDEIEKAHPDVLHSLLQILEEGRLTDGLGRAVDFRNTIVIMTSNVGADLLRRGSGLGFAEANPAADYAAMRDQTMEAAKHAFRPELLNRVDEVIVFRQLGEEDVRTILDIEIRKVSGRLKARGLSLHLLPEATAFLMKKGFDRVYGARQLRRTVERWLENPLAEEILRGAFPEESIVEVASDGERLNFREPEGDAAALAEGKTGELPFPADDASGNGRPPA
jgi:ATP-dependent Clp protease ATP-binding subunit ClpC